MRGKRILIVEDEFYIADQMATEFSQFGASILGPVASIDEAFELIDRDVEGIDGAVLDVNVQGRAIYPLADRLHAKGIPFVFTTGYDRGSIPLPYRDAAIYQKPVDTAAVAWALAH